MFVSLLAGVALALFCYLGCWGLGWADLVRMLFVCAWLEYLVYLCVILRGKFICRCYLRCKLVLFWKFVLAELYFFSLIFNALRYC